MGDLRQGKSTRKFVFTWLHAIFFPPTNEYLRFFGCLHNANAWEDVASGKVWNAGLASCTETKEACSKKGCARHWPTYLTNWKNHCLVRISSPHFVGIVRPTVRLQPGENLSMWSWRVDIDLTVHNQSIKTRGEAINFPKRKWETGIVMEGSN